MQRRENTILRHTTNLCQGFRHKPEDAIEFYFFLTLRYSYKYIYKYGKSKIFQEYSVIEIFIF